MPIERRPPPIEEVVQRLAARMARDGIRMNERPSPAVPPKTKTVGSVHCAPATFPPSRNPGTHRRATAAPMCRKWPRASRTTAT